MEIDLRLTINKHVSDFRKATKLYNLRDKNHWLRWMIKVYSKDRKLCFYCPRGVTDRKSVV